VVRIEKRRASGDFVNLPRFRKGISDLTYPIELESSTGEAVLSLDPSDVSVVHEKGATRLIRSVGLNTIYQIGSQVAPAVAALASIPFLLRRLGPDAFGIVTIFSAALIYFMMLDLGLGRAATRFIAQSLEAGQPDDVRRYFWGSIILLTSIGVLVTIASLFAVPMIVSRWLKIPVTYTRAASESFYVLFLTIPILTLISTLRGFLEAWGRFPFISVVTGCSGVALYLLPVVAILMGGGIVAIAVSYALVRVSVCAAFAIGCLATEGRPGLRPIFDFGAVKRMLSFGGWLSVSNVVGNALGYGDRFLLGVCVGMTAVASYGMPLDVISKMQILITSLCAVLFPLLSRVDESGSARFHTVYRGAVATTLSFMTPLAISAVLAAPFLMKHWLGARNTLDTVFIAQVFLAGLVVQAMAAVSYTALHARGRSDFTAWVHLAELPVYCAAFYLAATHFGVRGAVLAWLGRAIVDFSCMAILLGVHSRRPGFTIPPELGAALVPLGVLAIAVLPARQAWIVGAILCTLTWLWTWRTLLDPGMRMPLVRALLGRQDPDTIDLITNDRE
jgi:O-antigen/teichoic acid export membrane protein